MVEIITELGFPIACVVACGYFIWNTSQQTRTDNKATLDKIMEDNKTIQDKIMKDNNQREERMFNQLDKFGDSLDNFNTTLTKVDSRLEAVEKAVEIRGDN